MIAIFGVLYGSLVVSKLVVSGNDAATANNIIANESLFRVGIVLVLISFSTSWSGALNQTSSGCWRVRDGVWRVRAVCSAGPSRLAVDEAWILPDWQGRLYPPNAIGTRL